MPKIVTPKVFLLGTTTIVESGLSAFLSELGVPEWKTDAFSDAERLCEVAGKSCYLSFSTDLNKNLTKVGARNNHDYLQDGIIGTQHGSVLEHANVTFAFVDVSRVFTHELVRHRAGCAYSQVSGRYVRSDTIGYFLPRVIKDSGHYAVDIFERAFVAMEGFVRDLETSTGIDGMKDFKLKKTLTSAFRRLIGNGQANHIIATFNHRALRNIIQLRTSAAAEEEIRHVFSEVFRLCVANYPAIYDDAKAGAMVDGISEVIFQSHKV